MYFLFIMPLQEITQKLCGFFLTLEYETNVCFANQKTGHGVVRTVIGFIFVCAKQHFTQLCIKIIRGWQN